MKEPTAEETLLTRWIDGELSEEEATRLPRDRPNLPNLPNLPDWREEASVASVIGDRLRDAVPVEREMPYADFFNHQIQRRIGGDDVFAAERSPETAAREAEPVADAPAFSLFRRLRWMSGFGFALTLGALIAFVAVRWESPGGNSEIVSTYSPDPGVSVTSSYHSEADAAIIHLEGAPAISSATPLFSFVSDRGRLGDRRRVLFNLKSHEIGGPVCVLEEDGAEDGMPGIMLVGF